MPVWTVLPFQIISRGSATLTDTTRITFLLCQITNVAFKTEQNQNIQPCHPMEMLVSCLCDDTLSGPARWYTRFHIFHCSKCRMALKALIAFAGSIERSGE